MAVLADGRPGADGRTEPPFFTVCAGEAALCDRALREGDQSALCRARPASRRPAFRCRRIFHRRHGLLSLGGAVRASGPETRGLSEPQAVVRDDQGAAGGACLLYTSP